MSNVNPFAAAIGAAAAVTDMTKATAGGGGDYTPPAEGPCRLRFIGYVELGKHKSTFKDVVKVTPKVKLFFEVSGPKHPPREHEGKKYPHILTIEENLSLNEKARFFKLAQQLNHAGKATHIAELLGSAYKGRIVHRKYAKKGEAKDDASKWTGLAAELYDKKLGTYTIEAPRFEVVNEEGPTGEFRDLPVDPPLTPLKCFLWNFPDMGQWASIFVDGEYEERKDDKTGKVIAPAKSKNVLQLKIRSAEDWEGSPIATLLLNNGQTLDLNPHDLGGDEGNEGDESPSENSSTPATTTSRSDMVDPLAGLGA